MTRKIVSVPKPILKPAKVKVPEIRLITTKQVQVVRTINPQPQKVVQPKPTIELKPAPSFKKQPKPTSVRYVTAEPSSDSLPKIIAIKDIGKGRILNIIANGPSINEVNLEKLKTLDVDTVSVNHPDIRVWPTTYWSFFDSTQMRRHEKFWDSYEGIIFNSTAIKKQKEKSMQFKNKHGNGFSRDLKEGLYIGRSSVYALMQIALWMNYDHIYIWGCDMNPNGLNGKLHFYGENPDARPEDRKKAFEREAQYYMEAANSLTDEERSRFKFCSDYNNWPFVNKYVKLNHRVAMIDLIDKLGE